MQIEAVHRLPETELGIEFEPDEGLVGRVLATGKPVILDNYGELDRISLPEHAGNAVIGVPIPGPNGGLLGVFGIGARPPRKFGQSDLDDVALVRAPRRDRDPERACATAASSGAPSA